MQPRRRARGRPEEAPGGAVLGRRRAGTGPGRVDDRRRSQALPGGVHRVQV
uniref:Uncharacterized protein n=1 Tax=Arundo donax TaxID=35708 RepID=A0A0A9FLZ9_ARUDO